MWPDRGKARCPRGVVELIQDAVCHHDPQRYALCYELLWRVQQGERALLDVASDRLMHRLLMLRKAVRNEVATLAVCLGGQLLATAHGGLVEPSPSGPEIGPALVANDGFSARYDLDRIKGVFSRPQHKLAGESYVGRVLVLDAAKGGVATAWMLYEMKSRGIMPAALVLNAVNPIMAQGAALADFTMISGFEADITQAIPNGAVVEVDPRGERPWIRLV